MKYIKEDAGMLEQKWYTVADVAALTGLTDRTIRNYLKEGTLHGKKVGVQWRFTQQDIESLFREADVTEPFTELWMSWCRIFCMGHSDHRKWNAGFWISPVKQKSCGKIS